MYIWTCRVVTVLIVHRGVSLRVVELRLLSGA